MKDELLSLHTRDAEQFQIFRDSQHRQKAELKKLPIYVWTNPVRSGGQDGAVFVWLSQGCPEVVASIFSYPSGNTGKRAVMHEFHSLSDAVLVPVRESEHTWEPQAALERKPVPGAPAPGENARVRLVQMRALVRDFSAHSFDLEQQRWELRLLPQPLYRYESTRKDILDGALFTFATSAGTDPEVMIGLEARKFEGGASWQYYVVRFSDLSLHVLHKNKEVWTSIRDEQYLNNDRRHLYRLYTDRTIPDFATDCP